MTRARLLPITLSFLFSLTAEPAMSQFVDRSKAHLLLQPADISHDRAGLWVTGDGNIRHTLLPGGRYTEARGQREEAYKGRYEIRGSYIYYWDDTGFTADGEFIGDVLHHGGMILHRSSQP